MLRIALPSGRSLEEHTLQLFRDAQIPIEYNPPKHTAKVDCSLISEAIFVRPKNIPDLLLSLNFDLGICGSDTVHEYELAVQTNARKEEFQKRLQDPKRKEWTFPRIADLSYSRRTFGKTKIVLFTSPKEFDSIHARFPADTIKEWEKPGIGGCDAPIISEYPRITEEYVVGSDRVREIDGSCEAYVPKHFRYGVCLTETGKSLEANGLKILKVLYECGTVLVANPRAMEDPEKVKAIHILKLLLVGAVEARTKVLLKMNVPNNRREAIISALPSLHAPTVAELSDGKFVAVETVVSKSELSVLVPKLLELGAEGLLEIPISRVISKW